jgi:SNF family Na+-dependent transporter
MMAVWLDIYYIVMLSWALFYLVQSFSAQLPWGSCDAAWNTPTCVNSMDRKLMECWTDFQHNETVLCRKGNLTLPKSHFTDSVKEYWK